MINGAAKILNYGQPINWQAPLNRGLVGWWMTLPQQPARAKGLFRNLVGKNHATCGSATTLRGARPRATGIHGSSLRCDGTTNSAAEVTGSDYSFGGGNFSFGLWVNASPALSFIISTRTSSTAQGYEIVLDNSFSRGLRLGTSVSNYETGVAHVFDGWHFLFATVNVVAGSAKYFVDGKLMATVAIAGTITNSQTLRFGQRNASACTAMLNDARIYNRALADGDVLQLYRATCNGYQRELNWLNRKWMNAVVAAGGNRRRRLLIGS